MAKLKITPEIENKFIKFYSNGLGTVRIGKIFGCNKSTVARHLRKRGCRLRSNVKVTPNMKDKFTLLYKRGLSTRRIARRFGVGHETVRRYLHKSGIKLRVGTLKQIKKFAQKLTVYKAYILGVIGPGDGYLKYVKRTSEYKIGLSAISKEFVDFFAFRLRKTFGLSLYRYTRKRKKKTHNQMYVVELCSKLACEDLLKYGVSFKGKNWKVPKLIKKTPQSIKTMYLRGMADSQGYVGNKRIELCSKNKKGLEEIKELLISLGIKDCSIGKNSLVITARRSLELFAKKVNFTIKYKREGLKKLLNNYKLWIVPSKDIDKMSPKIVTLRKNGFSQNEIAKLLNISQSSVSLRLKREGLR